MKILAAALTTAVMIAVQAPLSAADFAFGADVSFAKQAEDNGMVFRDGTNALPVLQILKNHGYNWIRLRLFVEPVADHLPDDLAYTIAEARDARKLGFRFLLDLHYASSWADPGKQPTPEAWKNLTHRQRVKKVFTYSRDTIAAFRLAGLLPDMVQIGNEVTHGMLWPDGRLPEHWNNFADYVRAGIKGVDAGSGTKGRPKIMIHIDQGGNLSETKYFFDHLDHYHIHYDVIGFSYYPWWHGTLMDLRDNLAFTAKRYHKDIMIVETAYYWRPPPEAANRPGPFPETPEGQREYLDELMRIVLQTPDQRCKGIFWWEPAVGRRNRLVYRSFFDKNGHSLPALTVFDKYTRPAPRQGGL